MCVLIGHGKTSQTSELDCKLPLSFTGPKLFSQSTCFFVTAITENSTFQRCDIILRKIAQSIFLKLGTTSG